MGRQHEEDPTLVMTAQGSPASSIRHAANEDLPAIVAIYNESIPGRTATADTVPVTVEQRRDWFERRDPRRHPILVYEEGGLVNAWAAASPFFATRPAYYRTSEVSLYVSYGNHRKGVGTILFQRLLDVAKEGDTATALALVFSHNHASLRFMERFGFESWGRLPGVTELDSIERDVIILGKRLRD